MSENHQIDGNVLQPKSVFSLIWDVVKLIFGGLFFVLGVFAAAAPITLYFDPVECLGVFFLAPCCLALLISAWLLFVCCFINNPLLSRPIDCMGKRRATVLGGLLLCAFAAAVSVFASNAIYPVEGVCPIAAGAPSGGLPETGVNFQWRRGARTTFYCKFSISESNYRAWIQSQSRWEYNREITEPQEPFFNSNPFSNTKKAPTVTHGWEAGLGQQRGGRALFDRDTSTAYYWMFY